MTKNRTLKVVYSALFAALTFVGTQFIRVPLPFGYFNLGDCFVIISAVTVGGPYAVIASAIGSVLSDVISGYAVYAPATLIIKSLMVIVMIALPSLDNKNKAVRSLFLTVKVIISEAVMVCGYFIYDSILYDFAGAFASLFGNILQGVVSVIIGVLVITVIEHGRLAKHLKLQ